MQSTLGTVETSQDALIPMSQGFADRCIKELTTETRATLRAEHAALGALLDEIDEKIAYHARMSRLIGSL